MTLWVGLPDLANKNTGHPVNFESLISGKCDFSISMSQNFMETLPVRYWKHAEAAHVSSSSEEGRHSNSS